MVTLENETRGIVIVGAGAGRLAYAITSSSDRIHKFTFAEELRQLNEITQSTAFEIRRLAESLRELDYHIEDSLETLSLKKSIKQRFINPKVQLIKTYNRKPLSRSIRNNLPQRIRINEKPML